MLVSVQLANFIFILFNKSFYLICCHNLKECKLKRKSKHIYWGLVQEPHLIWVFDSQSKYVLIY
jgi:hypothetical protein